MHNKADTTSLLRAIAWLFSKLLIEHCHDDELPTLLATLLF